MPWIPARSRLGKNVEQALDSALNRNTARRRSEVVRGHSRRLDATCRCQSAIDNNILTETHEEPGTMRINLVAMVFVPDASVRIPLP